MTPDTSKSVKIAENIYWVGNEIPDDKFQCHVYLIVNGEDSVLIDPGSRITWPETSKKIQEHIPLESIKYLICHHQDPDITGAVDSLLQEAPRPDRTIVCHWRAEALLVHYDWNLPFYRPEDHGWQLVLSGGRRLNFAFTPYLHFPGAICTFDEASGILFSSDIFGAFTENFQLFAKDESYLEQMRPFHEHYMPSREILNHGLKQIEKLPIRMIAPQHGSIIREKLVQPLMNALKKMDCGLFLMPVYQNSIRELSRLNSLYRNLMDALLSGVRLLDTVDKTREFLTEIAAVESIFFYVWDESGMVFRIGGGAKETEKPLGIEVGTLRKTDLFAPLFRDREVMTVVTDKLPSLALPELRNVCLAPLATHGSPPNGIAAVIMKSGADTTAVSPFLDELRPMLGIISRREEAFLTVEHEREQFYRRAVLDMLTGLYNRYYMSAEGVKEVQKAVRYGYPLSCIMMDIDYFKAINDTHGHPVGDAILEEIGHMIRQIARDVDLPVRYGGEEFLLILPHTNLNGAAKLAERLRSQISFHTFRPSGVPIPVTVSCGVAEMENGNTLSDLVKHADVQLYRAKEDGRNRVNFQKAEKNSQLSGHGTDPPD
ncbi:MAG: diguanylate cyclase [Holophagae bacterium]|nr:diguanylate cyclase [Holophagae bacterium]